MHEVDDKQAQYVRILHIAAYHYFYSNYVAKYPKFQRKRYLYVYITMSCLIEGHIEGCYRENRKETEGNVATNLKEKILSAFSLTWAAVELTNNLAKRNWNGPKNCVFCYYIESIQHLPIKTYMQVLYRGTSRYFTEEPTGEA
ncbi:hypothetical protein ACJX0J_035713 [Zea mays]